MLKNTVDKINDLLLYAVLQRLQLKKIESSLRRFWSKETLV